MMIVVVFLLVFISGCSHQSHFSEQKKQWAHVEAKLHDVPIMFQACPGKTVLQPDVVSAQYTVKMSCDDVQQWYAEHMERMGWQQLYTFATTHVVMMYEKPSRYCALILETKGKETFVIIDVGYKQDYVSL